MGVLRSVTLSSATIGMLVALMILASRFDPILRCGALFVANLKAMIVS